MSKSKVYTARSDAEAKALHDGGQTVIVIPATDDRSAISIQWVNDIETYPGGRCTGWIKVCGAPMSIPIEAPYSPGDVIAVKEAMWISDCGKYFARPFRHSDPRWASATDYDVIERTTGTIWLTHRYCPKGWHDKDRRHTHPEFPRMVGYWGNRDRQLRSGRWVRAFELGFSDHDQSKAILPLKGNTILHSYSATFHRRWPARQMPLSLVTLNLTVKAVECKQQDGQWQWLVEVE